MIRYFVVSALTSLQYKLRYKWQYSRTRPHLLGFNISVVIAFLFLCSINSWADELNRNPLKAIIQSTTLIQNDTVPVVIDLNLDSGYHAYLDRFELKILEPTGFIVKKFELSPIVKFHDVFSKQEREGVQETAQLKAWILTPNSATRGSTKFVWELTYQACTEKHCLFPSKLRLPAEMSVADSQISQGTESEEPKSFFTSLSIPTLDQGFLITFLTVFLAGFLTSLTPCIFPMIPITLSIIGASQMRHGGHKKNRAKGFSLSVTYVLGIAITYACLGLLAAKTGSLFGSALSNIYVVLTLAAIFVGLGLSMYGLYEIQIPNFIRHRLHNMQTGPGYVGAFISGLIAGVVASPCVGPVLVSLLAFVAQTQNLLLGFMLLFVFALGMGVILVVLGTFGGLLAHLPRSGPWMDFVKFVFGTAMIAMAIYYIKPFLSDGAVFVVTGVTAILIASFFGAFLPSRNLKGINKIRKGSMLALLILGAGFVVRGSLTNDLHIWIRNQASENQEEKLSEWKPFSDDVFEEAISKGESIVIDFYADWCVACKELDHFTFSSPQVKEKLQSYRLFRVDLTVENEKNSGLKERFQVMGLPTVLIFEKGKLIREKTLTGFESANEFAARLEKR